jgi:hypothetical protein
MLVGMFMSMPMGVNMFVFVFSLHNKSSFAGCLIPLWNRKQ